MSSPSGRSRRADVSKLFESLQKEATSQAPSLTNSLGMKFTLVPAGTFRMGSAEAGARANEMPAHDVILTQAYYLGTTPVTQSQYLSVMGENPSRFTVPAGGGPKHPVERVSWQDAVRFCKTLSNLPEEQGRSYRLPTEAEWERAARAGGATVFAHGDVLMPAQANFDDQSGGSLQRTTEVGRYPANNFGLFDMHGNVWEWCHDWYDEAAYARGTVRDPRGPEDAEFRVVRGGSWRSQAGTCRAAYRNALAPRNRDPYTGFRVICVLNKE